MTGAILKLYNAPSVEEWQLLFVKLLPGAHVAAIASEGCAYHRMTVNLEDAGFQIRDQIVWIGETIIPIALARRPLSAGTVAANVLKYGTGAINVDGCRIGTQTRTYFPAGAFSGRERSSNLSDVGNDKTSDGRTLSSILKRKAERQATATPVIATGRFPANVILTKAAGSRLDEQSGPTRPGHFPRTDVSGIWGQAMNRTTATLATTGLMIQVALPVTSSVVMMNRNLLPT